jgi:hypothetical protein
VVEDWRRRGGIAAAQGSVDGGVALGSSGSTAAQRHGELGGAVAAEGERERAAVAKKKGWGGLGVRVVRATAPVAPANSLLLDLIQARAASRRKRRLGCWPVGPCERGEGSPGVRRSGPRSAAGRPASGEKNRGGEGEGKRMLTCGPRVSERKGSAGESEHAWAGRTAREGEKKAERGGRSGWAAEGKERGREGKMG